MSDKFDEIWDATLGRTLDISEQESTISNGMTSSTAELFAEFEDKSDAEVLKALSL